MARAVFNTSIGQRIGVVTNRGYRSDAKEIKAKNKELKTSYKSIADKSDRKSQMKTLKSDYKKTKREARVSAANALYRSQSNAANTKIQTSNLGKQILKSFLAGGVGAKTYDELSANGHGKVKSAALGFLAGVGNSATQGLVGVTEYIGRTAYQNSKEKKVNS